MPPEYPSSETNAASNTEQISGQSAGESKNSFVDEETRETIYRSGYITQATGFLLIAISYLLSIGYYAELIFVSGSLITLFGILLSSVFLRISKKELKKFIIGSAAVGIVGFILAFSLAGAFAAEIFFGIGCVSLSFLLGKEAHCYGYPEGRIMMYLLPPVVLLSLVDLVLRDLGIVMTFAWVSVLAVLMSFILKKLKTPLTKQPDSKSS